MVFDQHTSPPRSGLSSLTIVFILGLLVLVCHGLSLKAPFMIDDLYYVNAVHVQQLDLLTILGSRLKDPGHHFHPLDQIVLTIIFSLFREPFWIYGLNLIFFLFNVLLFYKIVYALFSSKQAALVSAVLFIAHPFNADVLCHATFSTVLLTAVFSQLSLLFYLKNLALGFHKTRWLLYSLFFYVIALFYLETSLLFPGYLTAFCLFLPGIDRKQALKYTSPYWALSVLYLFLVNIIVDVHTHLISKWQYLKMSFVSFSATLSYLLTWYFNNLFVPDEIVLIKNSAPVRHEILYWNVVLFLAGILIFLLLFRWKNTLKGACLAWFFAGFIFILPASTVHAYSMGVMIEPYWFYFPAMGFFMFTGVSLWELRQFIGRSVWMALILAISLFWGIATFRQHVIGRTEIGYLQYWLEKCPENHMPSLLLGTLFVNHPEYKISKTLMPFMTRQVDEFVNRRQTSQAAKLLERLIEQYPAHHLKSLWDFTLTALYFKIGQNSTANQRLRFFHAADPQVRDYALFISQLERLELHDKALLILEQGLKLYPGHPDLIYLKMIILANCNRFSEAENILIKDHLHLASQPRFSILLEQIQHLKMNHGATP